MGVPEVKGVPERIAGMIRDGGPMPFSEFMGEALYGEGGFYSSPPVGSGAGSAFATSPHVHPVFGQLLGAALAELWDLLREPSPFRLVEVGAGDGTLARQLIGALAHLDELAYTAVETSAAARELLRAGGVSTTERLPTEGADVFLANELLDNLPFDLVIDGSDVKIGLDHEGRFVPLVDGEPVDSLAGAEVRPFEALSLIDRLADAMTVRPSFALLIDYGGVGASGGPVHGYRAHTLVEEILDEPGSSDITSGIDLALLTERAHERGLVAHEPILQREALIALGLERWIEEELQEQQRLLDDGRGIEAVRAWSGRSRATLLAEPSGLGRLKWFLLSSPGLPEPSWLSR
jgi:NADH dehydrogenase [ubiquinone] 1 alpha subcomplex assembly factor 7